MKEIVEALTAKQALIKQLQRDVDALQKAAGILAGGQPKAKAPVTPKAKPTRKPRAKAQSAEPKAKRKRPTMDAAARRAVSKRMKAYWAKRRKAKG